MSLDASDLDPSGIQEHPPAAATDPGDTEASSLPVGVRDRVSQTSIAANEAQWSVGLEYIFNNERRAVLRYEDFLRLEEGEMLNDNVIDFLMAASARELSKVHPEVSRSTHWFNTWFYPGLLHASKTARPLQYRTISKWTKGIDLLSKDYLVIPVHEEAHWYLVIICNLSRLVRSSPQVSSEKLKRAPSTSEVEHEQDVIGVEPKPRLPPVRRRKYCSETPTIIVLDSLEGGKHYDTIQVLRSYLRLQLAEARSDVKWQARMIQGIHAPDLPKQNNWWDCGVYMLGYLHAFVENPQRFLHSTFDVRNAEISRWQFLQPDELRSHWRQAIETELQKRAKLDSNTEA